MLAEVLQHKRQTIYPGSHKDGVTEVTPSGEAIVVGTGVDELAICEMKSEFEKGEWRPIASGIIAATPPSVEPNTLLRLHRKLEENGVVCAPREGMLRFAPHFYNDERDVQRVIDVLSSS